MMFVCVCVCVCVCWRLPPGSLPSPAGDAPRMFLPSSRLLSLPGNGAKEWGGGEEEEEEEWEDSYQNLTSCFHGFGNRSVGT